MNALITHSLSVFILTTGGMARAAEVHTPPPPKDKISICVPYFREEFLSLAVMAARDRGFFAKNGLDVSIVAIPSADVTRKKRTREIGQLPPNLLNDYNVALKVSQSPATCQFGTSNVERFLSRDDIAQSETIPLLLSSYGEDYDTHLVVAADSKIKTVADLKGKTIRMGQAPVRMALEEILSEAGLTLADVKQAYSIRATDVLASLESGKLDAAVTYVPTMPYMLASGKVRILKSNIVKNYLGASIPHSLVIANRKFAAHADGTVKRFILAVNQASDYIRRNPTEAIYVLQRNSALLGAAPWKLSAVTVEKAGEFIGKISTVDLYNSAPSRVEAQSMLKNYGSMLKSHGLVTEQVDLSAWLNLAVKDNKVTAL